MKTLLASVTLLFLCGCIAPNYLRAIPETKDVRVMAWNPVYGWVLIESRAQGSSNVFTPLPAPFTPLPVQ